MRCASLLFAIGLVIVASPLSGHCDSMKGPVVIAAQQALEKGDVTSVLKWVPASREAEIRDAFAKALIARKASPEAREVVDLWFFETLVRVHRESEGEPFAGLKGADYQPEEGIELADEAITSGSIGAAEKSLVVDVHDGLRKRFAEVIEAKEHANESVNAGRHYVKAYVEFIHYVERLHESATTAAGERAAH